VDASRRLELGLQNTISGPRPVLYSHEGQEHLFQSPGTAQRGSVQAKPSDPPVYLTCSTTTASFLPATVLEQTSSTRKSSRGVRKISVFEDINFKRGRTDKKICPILVLQLPNVAFAGLIRLTSKDHINKATPLELIGISTGSAKARDLRQSLEWRIFETGSDSYRDGNTTRSFHYEPKWINDNGEYALVFNVVMAFDSQERTA
jgi:hypothetical protein